MLSFCVSRLSRLRSWIPSDPDLTLLVKTSVYVSNRYRNFIIEYGTLADLYQICDSPVSGGSTRAAAGTLVIMTSGSPSAVERARPVLDALTQKPEGNLQVVGDTCGAASDFKMINQVLCTAQITMAG